MSKDIYQTAINLLTHREHSQLELQHKLLDRDFSIDEIKQVLIELAQQRLQSDERFTESYINMRTNRGYGQVRIAAELYERGISEALITQYLKDSGISWQQRIQEVWCKKFKGKISQDFKEHAKQINFLKYRGFTLEQINNFFRQL